MTVMFDQNNEQGPIRPFLEGCAPTLGLGALLVIIFGINPIIGGAAIVTIGAAVGLRNVYKKKA